MKRIVKGERFTYENYKCYVDLLNREFPSLTLADCGKTLLGKTIYGFVTGEGEDNVLYVGGTHGLEWITSLLLLRFLENLATAYEDRELICGFNVEDILKNKRLIVIPELNPDGIDIALTGENGCGKYRDKNVAICNGDFSSWSANARGVDINHNFNADWYNLREKEQEENIFGPSPRRHGGRYPESEPETKAITRLCRNIDISLLVTFHSQGEEIYYEYGNNTPEKSLYIAKMLSSLTDYTLVKNEGLGSSGGLKDWFIEEFKKPAFTIEVGKGKNPLPLKDFDDIYNRVESMMIAGLLF